MRINSEVGRYQFNSEFYYMIDTKTGSIQKVKHIN